MQYLSREMDEAHLERQWRAEIASLRLSVEQRLTALETPARVTANLAASPNYILNSHPEWSKQAWENAGVSASTVSDNNRWAYNWYYQTTSDSGQDLSSSNALIASGHTSFSASGATPIWDQANAQFVIGHETTNYDVSTPLSRDFVFPGQRYYIYFETLLAESDADLQGIEFFCGFWDNTSGQRKWIEGSDFTPTASIFGAGGTRTLTYKVLATTDSNEQILSTDIVVNNAPNALTDTNHVRLFFSGAPGFISFQVYRFDGVTYRLVGEVRNSIDLQFFDLQENIGTLATGFPNITTQRPRAYKKTVGLTGNALSYTAHTLVLQVPTTYNRGNTSNNQQWFRWGITGPASKKRALAVRRVMVSEGFGPWVRAQGDLTIPLSSPSSTATSAPAPDVVIGTAPGDGPYCVTLDTKVDVITHINGFDIVNEIAIKDIEMGAKLVCGSDILPVLSVKDGIVQETYTLRTESGLQVTSSASHRFLRSRFDKSGTAVNVLKVGDYILTSKNGKLDQEMIADITINVGETMVRTVSLPAPHIFVTNGIVSHNIKYPVDETTIPTRQIETNTGPL